MSILAPGTSTLFTRPIERSQHAPSHGDEQNDSQAGLPDRKIYIEPSKHLEAIPGVSWSLKQDFRSLIKSARSDAPFSVFHSSFDGENGSPRMDLADSN